MFLTEKNNAKEIKAIQKNKLNIHTNYETLDDYLIQTGMQLNHKEIVCDKKVLVQKEPSNYSKNINKEHRDTKEKDEKNLTLTRSFTNDSNKKKPDPQNNLN